MSKPAYDPMFDEPYEDILFSVPWNCGEKDCPVGWHLATYWTTGSKQDLAEGYPYTVDDYTDGDHESCMEEDLPSYKEQQEEWESYFRDVAEGGEDVLGQFHVKTFIKTKEVWKAKFEFAVQGFMVQFKRRGEIRAPSEHARAFFGIGESTNPSAIYLGFYKSDIRVDEFKELGLECGKWTQFKIDARKGRSPEVVKKELKKLARKSLKRRDKDGRVIV